MQNHFDVHNSKIRMWQPWYLFKFYGGISLHPAESYLCPNTPTEKQFAVKDVVEGIEYEFRVSAINISGSGEPSPPSEFVFARDPKSE